MVLGGGYGCARFLEGLLYGIEHRVLPGVAQSATVTVVVNTADDLWIHGLRVCPDLDTIMYTLGDGIDPDRGWGRRHETWTVKEELAAYDAPAPWFGLGDRDIATHLVRSRLLRDGASLSEVTETLCRRWLPGVRLLPMTDDEVETHVLIEEPDGTREVHFQEYWVGLGAKPAIRDLLFQGMSQARPGPSVIDAIAAADLVLFAPSNPIVSIGTILSVSGVAQAVQDTSALVVGLSPIVGGSHVRGMAEQLLGWAGVEVSAGGVGRHYGARARGGVLDGWLVDERDAAELPRLVDAGLVAEAVPLMMTGPGVTASMVRAGLELFS